MAKINDYYQLTKPGIIRGNLISVLAGFFLASRGDVNFVTMFAILAGTSLIIGSGCVFNNYLDIDIDKYMERTKNRALVTGKISIKNGIIFSLFLGVIGLLVLTVYTNLLTVVLGILGWIFYVVVYGIGKRKSVHGTLIGSISGAIPPVAGYTAVTGSLDVGALLLFLILVAWQMPHFYAIAVYRQKDYEAASIPVLPAVKGLKPTVNQIIFYTLLFVVSTCLLYFYGYAESIYLLIMLVVGSYWLYICIKGLKTQNYIKWAHSVFGVSLLVLLIFSVAVTISSFIV